MNNSITRALRQYLDKPVPLGDGGVVLLPQPLTFAEAVAVSLVNKAIGTRDDSVLAAQLLAEMLHRSSEFDPAYHEED